MDDKNIYDVMDEVLATIGDPLEVVSDDEDPYQFYAKLEQSDDEALASCLSRNKELSDQAEVLLLDPEPKEIEKDTAVSIADKDLASVTESVEEAKQPILSEEAFTSQCPTIVRLSSPLVPLASTAASAESGTSLASDESGKTDILEGAVNKDAASETTEQPVLSENASAPQGQGPTISQRPSSPEVPSITGAASAQAQMSLSDPEPASDETREMDMVLNAEDKDPASGTEPPREAEQPVLSEKASAPKKPLQRPIRARRASRTRAVNPRGSSRNNEQRRYYERRQVGPYFEPRPAPQNWYSDDRQTYFDSNFYDVSFPPPIIDRAGRRRGYHRSRGPYWPY